ncbi:MULTISPECIES: AraC family ligand binding domain-containing protein [unclassified Streptomyces]|uniref:cupin domain-containing protein n=1 Tax=unclassified Streptomyces TaxID=2593676 RepID=UPI003369D570
MPSVAGVQGRVSDLMREVTADRGGALWRLAAEGRQLDSNVIRLPADGRVDFHVEQDLDVLLYVTGGSGWLEVADARQELEPGCVTWLPHGTRRALSAGADGLVYLTVHRRRPGLTIRSAARPAARPAAPEGGEPACLLNRVCTECGRLAQESDARYCARCGTRLPSD